MELVNSVFNFFTDRTKKLSHKTITIFIVVAVLIVMDNTLSFTSHYNNIRKIEEVEKLNLIVIDSTLSKEEVIRLKELRNNIINHKTWKDKLYDKIITIDFKTKDNDNVSVVKNDIPKTTNERSYWVHFVTSSWILIMIMIIMPFAVFFDKKSSSLSSFLAIIFVIVPFFCGLSWVFAKAFSLIPVINNNPTYNYVLNAVIHLFIFLLIGFLSNKKKN